MVKLSRAVAASASSEKTFALPFGGAQCRPGGHIGGDGCRVVRTAGVNGATGPRAAHGLQRSSPMAGDIRHHASGEGVSGWRVGLVGRPRGHRRRQCKSPSAVLRQHSRAWARDGDDPERQASGTIWVRRRAKRESRALERSRPVAPRACQAARTDPGRRRHTAAGAVLPITCVALIISVLPRPRTVGESLLPTCRCLLQKCRSEARTCPAGQAGVGYWAAIPQVPGARGGVTSARPPWHRPPPRRRCRRPPPPRGAPGRALFRRRPCSTRSVPRAGISRTHR